jgi:hypothetical protein
MNRPPLRLARLGQLPAPATGEGSLQVLTEAIDSLAASARPTGSATLASASTPWPASSPRPNDSCPRPSATPATRNSPGPRSANCSAPPLPQQHAATGTSHDQLDKDHRHNVADRVGDPLAR